MENVAVIAGQSVTVGMVASIIAQFAKGQNWIPKNALLIRLMVALTCVVINGLAVMATGSLDWQLLVQSFFSYAVAAMAYDHLFKP